MNLSGDEVLWNAFGETGGGLQQFCARWKHVDRSNAEADSDARASEGTIAARGDAMPRFLKSCTAPLFLFHPQGLVERQRQGYGNNAMIITCGTCGDAMPRFLESCTTLSASRVTDERGTHYEESWWGLSSDYSEWTRKSYQTFRAEMSKYPPGTTCSRCGTCVQSALTKARQTIGVPPAPPTAQHE